jgi:hypothetical protein
MMRFWKVSKEGWLRNVVKNQCPVRNHQQDNAGIQHPKEEKHQPDI